ncbi:MAG TPA: hypothetical protein VND93_23930, partial [Myxococcales bacterium]|nr:hypothetical protein [Myxococcales bacterium]
ALAVAVIAPRAPLATAAAAAERVQEWTRAAGSRPAASKQRPAPRPALEHPGPAAAVAALPPSVAPQPVAPATRAPSPNPALDGARSPGVSWLSPAPSPASGEERKKPSLLAALERLVRTLQDMGLVDDDLQLVPAARAAPVAVAGNDVDLAGPEGTFWMPVSWTGAQAAHSTLAISPGEARLSELSSGVLRTEDPLELAEARFALAQALWDSDRERALRLAQQAQAALQSDTSISGSNELLNKITEWIEARQLQ